MGLGPQRKDSKTFGTTVYGLTHPRQQAQGLVVDISKKKSDGARKIVYVQRFISS